MFIIMFITNMIMNIIIIIIVSITCIIIIIIMTFSGYWQETKGSRVKGRFEKSTL